MKKLIAGLLIFSFLLPASALAQSAEELLLQGGGQVAESVDGPVMVEPTLPVDQNGLQGPIYSEQPLMDESNGALLDGVYTEAAFAGEQFDEGVLYYSNVYNPNPQERLHLRQSPNAQGRSLGKYYTGTAVAVLEEVSDQWARVRIGQWPGAVEGYMMRSFLSSDGGSGASAQPVVRVVEGTRLNLRSGPSTDAQSFGLYEGGTPVTVMGIDRHWYHVNVNGQTGFMMAEYLTPMLDYTLSSPNEGQSTLAYGVVNNPDPKDRLHLRVSPNSSSQSLGKYYNGVTVQILEKGNGWVKVRIGNLDGYMDSSFLLMDAPDGSVAPAMPVVRVESSSGKKLNLRAGQSQKTASLGLYDNGTPVEVLGITPTWYHVKIGGQMGFMMAEYLEPQLGY